MRSTSSASSPGGACFGRDGSKDSSNYSKEQTLSFRKTLFLVKLQSNHNNLGGVQMGVVIITWYFSHVKRSLLLWPHYES